MKTSEYAAVTAAHSVDPERWQAQFSAVLDRIAPRFVLYEPLRHAGALMAGMVSGLDRKNCWTIAEHPGAATPDGLQHLLGRREQPDLSGPIGSGGTDGPDLGVARSVGVLTGLCVSVKVAVCWKHRPSSPASTISSTRSTGFLRRTDSIIDRLADYLHATGRDQPQPRAQLATGVNRPGNPGGS